MSRAYERDSLLPPLWVIGLLGLGGMCWLLYELKEIVTLLVVGYSIAYVMEPGLKWFERRRVPRPFGVGLIIAALVLVLVLLFVTAIPTLMREYDKFVVNLPSYTQTAQARLGELLDSARDYIPEKYLSPASLLRDPTALSDVAPGVIRKAVSGAGQALLSGYSVTLALANLLLLPFIVYYIAVDFPRLHAWALSLFPLLKRERVRRVALEMDTYVAAFVRGQLLVCAIMAVLYALGLGVVGVELWLLLAVVAGFGNVVPYLGGIIGIVLSSLMALVTFHDFAHVLAVWGVFAVVQFLEGTFITPRVIGDKVGLSPLVVILAVVAGGSLFGLLGVFLAVPAAAVLKVLFAHLGDWIVTRG